MWHELISNTIEECGAEMDDSTIKAIVETIEGAIENMLMIDGCPATVRIDGDKLQRRIRELEEEVASLQRQVKAYRSSIAQRRNVSETEIYVEDGNVFYGRV